MNYQSTRHSQNTATFTEAVLSGLAPDGGLWVPTRWPTEVTATLTADLPYPDFAAKLLQPFFEVKTSLNDLTTLCKMAFDFPVPLRQIRNNLWLLELFHGPTLAFKDFGARFLSACYQRFNLAKPMTLLVATSGDTGSAIASAFHGHSTMRVVILFPEGKITARQQQQITCWGDNVLAVAVRGTFDDCQRLVKNALQDPTWQTSLGVTTGNSINIARLLPQMVYYAYISLKWQTQHQTVPNFIVPCGNLGNVTAAYWAKQLGFPIQDILLATNANTVVPDFLRTGVYQACAAIATLANAMDVGNPSNLERLLHLFGNSEALCAKLQATSVSDDEIRTTLLEFATQNNLVVCPHTATALHVYNQLSPKQIAKPWIIVATAHPCKFEQVIEPILNTVISVPAQLATILTRPSAYKVIEPNLSALSTLVMQPQNKDLR